MEELRQRSNPHPGAIVWVRGETFKAESEAADLWQPKWNVNKSTGYGTGPCGFAYCTHELLTKQLNVSMNHIYRVVVRMSYMTCEKCPAHRINSKRGSCGCYTDELCFSVLISTLCFTCPGPNVLSEH